MKNPWVVVGIIMVVLFGGAIWYSSIATEKSNEGVVDMSQIKGNKDAAVTLVEYSDFQCPACASFQPVLKELLATYGENLKFEYKHYPLPIHPYAQQAAIAAEAAGQQGKFFEYHDALFENQAEWSKSATPVAFFNKYAEELGLDVEKFKQHQKASLLRERLKRSA
jgi:protein-disulfide isomerase